MPTRAATSCAMRLAELAQLDQGGIGIGGEDLFGGAGQLQEDGVVLGEKGEIAGNGQARMLWWLLAYGMDGNLTHFCLLRAGRGHFLACCPPPCANL